MKIDPFSKSPYIWHYGQPWLPQAETDFAPGRISITRENNDIVIHAELHDVHVMRDVFSGSGRLFVFSGSATVFLAQGKIGVCSEAVE